MENNPAPDWMDVADVMALLHVCQNTVYNLARRGILRKSRLGHRLYFRRSDIERILRSNMLLENGRIDRTAFLALPDTDTDADLPRA